jgi:hypothetical protein
MHQVVIETTMNEACTYNCYRVMSFEIRKKTSTQHRLDSGWNDVLDYMTYNFRDNRSILPAFFLLFDDVIKWSRALDIRLSDWCCSVSMV